jgi:hypothetical protein
MALTSAPPGTSNLDVEVTNVSTHGFWLMHVERPQQHHLYWPDLDIDLAVESIRHPEKFPLVSRVSA